MHGIYCKIILKHFGIVTFGTQNNALPHEGLVEDVYNCSKTFLLILQLRGILLLTSHRDFLVTTINFLK